MGPGASQVTPSQAPALWWVEFKVTFLRKLLITKCMGFWPLRVKTMTPKTSSVRNSPTNRTPGDPLGPGDGAVPSIRVLTPVTVPVSLALLGQWFTALAEHQNHQEP